MSALAHNFPLFGRLDHQVAWSIQLVWAALCATISEARQEHHTAVRGPNSKPSRFKRSSWMLTRIQKDISGHTIISLKSQSIPDEFLNGGQMVFRQSHIGG